MLIVDENGGANVAQALGIKAGFDFEHVIEGDCALEDVLLQGPTSVTLLPAAHAARALPHLDAAAQQRAVDCFGKLDRAADIVLLDASNDAAEPSAFARAAQEVIVVVSPGPSSITGGYAAIKRMTHAHGRSRFRLLVNRAADRDTAALIHENMAHVANRHLNTALEFMGAVPHDAAVPGARGATARSCSCTGIHGLATISGTGSKHRTLGSPGDHTSRLDSFMQRAIHGSRLGISGAGA